MRLSTVILGGIVHILFCCASEWSSCYEECCYYRSPSYVSNWTTGYNFCKGMDSDYASIHSEEENAFVIDTVCDGRCWLGLTLTETEDSWQWTDGSPMNYTNWVYHLEGKAWPDSAPAFGDWDYPYYNLYKWVIFKPYANDSYAVCKKCGVEVDTPSKDVTVSRQHLQQTHQPLTRRQHQPTIPTESTFSQTASVDAWVISSLNICFEILDEVHRFRDVNNRASRRRTDDQELDDEHLAARTTQQLNICSEIVGAVDSFQEQYKIRI